MLITYTAMKTHSGSGNSVCEDGNHTCHYAFSESAKSSENKESMELRVERNRPVTTAVTNWTRQAGKLLIFL